MALYRILFIILAAKLCIIDNILGVHISARLVNGCEIGHNKLPTLQRFKRDLNALEYFKKGEPLSFTHKSMKLWDMLMPKMKDNMEVFQGSTFLPNSTENYSPEEVTPSFLKKDQLVSNREDYFSKRLKEALQELNIKPETVLTKNLIPLEEKIPDSYLAQAPGNEIDQKKDDEYQLSLNAYPDFKKLLESMNSNSNEEAFTANQSEIKDDSPEDGVIECYNHCLQNCYGTSSAAPRSHCESDHLAKPLIININSECLKHPSQRFPPGYAFKPKLNANAMKFQNQRKNLHKYSSCPFSKIPPFHY